MQIIAKLELSLPVNGTPDGLTIGCRVNAQIEGFPAFFGTGQITMPFGLSHADMIAFIKQRLVEGASTFNGMTLDPDAASWQFFGLPVPDIEG